jgi:glycerol kinase
MDGSVRMILSIDQGTTSSRAIRFAADGTIRAIDQQEFPQLYPQNGWVEHDPEAIWQTTLATARNAVDDGVTAIGITNQRETILLWDRTTGNALHNAIVWQDRRTADFCAELRIDGLEPMIQSKTGLLLDPYFSASKLKWLLDKVPGTRARAERGELAAGTVDSFLLWRLTGGRAHATDITNAGRTMLCNIHTGDWDDELLRLFDVPRALLPEIHPNTHVFGETDPGLFGRAIPIAGMAGDQQSALIGQACFAPGMVKSTYGTGCFLLMNTGAEAVPSANRLLTTPAYSISGESAFALEGSIFVAGAAIKWLRDKVGIIAASEESEAMARQANPDHGLAVVPGFTGLGAPHWDAQARGLITGLTLDSSAADIVRATLEGIAWSTADLVSAMGGAPAAIRIDGGMSQNSWFAQFLADVLRVPVERPHSHETTAAGAATLAAITTGVYASKEDAAKGWACAARYEPAMPQSEHVERRAIWDSAMARTLSGD